MFERNNDLERKQLAPGVCITTLDASKFNRCCITLHLRFPAKRESATDAAVLALVLERGYAACPDMTALSRRLAELYGADLGVDLASAGTDRVLSADICGIKDAYALAGENLTAAYADIVFGTIFDPYLVDGAFDPEAVRIETETQARRLEAEFNSKRLYCVRQARRKFYGDTPAGIELGGYPGELVNVTPQSLKAEYDRILSTAYIDVMVQGVDEARVADMLLKKLDGIRRDPHPFAAPVAMPATPLRHFKEEIPGLTQAKLCMLFTTGEANPNPPSVSILRVAMSVLGDLVVGGLTKLYRRLYDEALVNPEFSGDFIAVRGACTVAFTGESDTPRQVVDLLQEEIERMRREGVDPEVFMLVKNQMYGELLGDVEAVDDAAEEAAAACLKGRTLADEIAALAELTVEDANALLQTALREENRAYVQIDPAEK